MDEWIKPPIGVSPHWFVYHSRMEELNKSIERYLEHIEKHNHTIQTKQYYECIAEWAKEIEVLALLEADLRTPQKERFGGYSKS